MIEELLESGKKLLSFEVFPPKKDDEFANAHLVLDRLAALKPDFISVTYGAGGSKSKKTVEIASYIQNQLHIPALAHITCVGSKKEDIDRVAGELKAGSIGHVLALRGDRPSYMSDEQYDGREFLYSTDLIRYLKATTKLQIAAACYPEKHYEAPDLASDLAHLKEKEAAGAGFLITQLFFDNDSFYRFCEEARKAGVRGPICAGIMPITSSKQLGTTVSLSGSSVPKKLADLIAAYGDTPEDMRKAGIDFAIAQILDLKAHQADGIHIYTMNKPLMAEEIVQAIR